jgi:NAD+ synthase (glutamine-hydrolysing)
MGLTYAELCIFGRLRKVERLGPVSMFDRMVYKDTYEDVAELATKIKRFFTYYSINRHKASTLPPTYYYDP